MLYHTAHYYCPTCNRHVEIQLATHSAIALRCGGSAKYPGGHPMMRMKPQLPAFPHKPDDDDRSLESQPVHDPRVESISQRLAQHDKTFSDLRFEMRQVEKACGLRDLDEIRKRLKALESAAHGLDPEYGSDTWAQTPWVARPHYPRHHHPEVTELRKAQAELEGDVGQLRDAVEKATGEATRAAQAADRLAEPTDAYVGPSNLTAYKTQLATQANLDALEARVGKRIDDMQQRTIANLSGLGQRITRLRKGLRLDR